MPNPNFCSFRDHSVHTDGSIDLASDPCQEYVYTLWGRKRFLLPVTSSVPFYSMSNGYNNGNPNYFSGLSTWTKCQWFLRGQNGGIWLAMLSFIPPLNELTKNKRFKWKVNIKIFRFNVKNDKCTAYVSVLIFDCIKLISLTKVAVYFRVLHNIHFYSLSDVN